MTDGVTLFLCGDVMLGRGVDQILEHPGDPSLRESSIHDARTYVRAAEAVSGRIGRPVCFSWPWGDALRTLDEVAPDVRVINLETSITRSDEFAPEKAVHYRMNPWNLPCVAVGRPDACVLANNHVLDFGRQGLEETLEALSDVGLTAIGAGHDAEHARRPATVTLDGGRVVIFAYGMVSSGVPSGWAATSDRPGVNFVPDLSDADCAEIIEQVRIAKEPGDVAVVSLHWGSNWNYEVSQAQTRFAHRLIDGGVDVVYGHSSHHPRPVEVYRDKLILYGCGDTIDDYEGIPTHEKYRHDLRLLYFPTVDPHTGTLTALRMVPMQARRMRLEHASHVDAEWLRATLASASHPFGSRIDLEPDDSLTLRHG
jgi:poly-gamma-glutamate capsule biosynthesis protein CapA/YwtB (metallophosphatase superfamily)